MIDWRGIEDTWQKWLQQTLGVPCVWAHQDAPAPELPYATLDIITVNALGAYDETHFGTVSGDDNAVAITDVGYRRVTLAIQIDAGLGDTPASTRARTLLSRVQTALRSRTVRASFRAQDVAVGDIGGISAFGLQLSDTMIARASMDVDFVVSTSSSTTVPSFPTDFPLDGEVTSA